MKNRIIAIAGALLFSITGFAQDPLPSDTFKVVKEYQPTLTDATKISFEPEIDDDLNIELDLDYNFINKQVPVSFEVEPIKPAKIKGEPLVKLYNGYAVLGVGNSLVPYGEIYYNTLRSKKYTIGGHAKYFNMVEQNKMEASDRSSLHAEVFGKRFWKKNTLTSAIAYDRHDFNYYGYYNIANPRNDVELPGEQLEQSYDKISAQVELKTTKQDSFNLRHWGELAYNMTSNKSGNAEHNIKTAVNLSQFKNSELYNLDVLIDYNQYDFNADNTIIGLKPQISTIGEKFRINAGLGVYLNAGDESDFHFYPLAEIKYNVIDDILVPYVGVRGEIQRVNYNTITEENLFVAEDIFLANANEKYNIYLGLRGTLSKKLSFNVSASTLKTDNDYLYVQLADTNRLLTKEYYLTYDEINEQQFKGELVYRMNEKLKLYALGQYFNYETDVELEAWHRPNLKISTSAEYNLRDKILVKADLIYWGEQYARGSFINTLVATENPQYNVVILDPVFDANLSFEYRYTKRLSAFVKFNNIGGINYEKYKDYPTQGFNVWGGFTYGF